MFRRLSGYVLLPLLLITAHLGGGWSTWATSHSHLWMRLVAYTVAPVVALVAIYARVRSADPLYNAYRVFDDHAGHPK
jgi:cytochrome b-561 domain containing protein 2